MPTRLIIIRHAQSEANAEGRIQGHLDIPLSPLGLRQSALLAERLAGHGVETLYSSPLRRARQTADVIAGRLDLVVHDIPALRERDVGVLQGLNRQEIIERFPEYAQPGSDVSRIKVEGFEQDSELTERVTTALSDILRAHADRTTAVVTHGGVIGTVLRWLLQLPRVRPGPFVIDNTSLTIIDVRTLDSNGSPHAQLVTLNDTCHLDALTNA
jgi:alpha-ribazole phosphatase